MNPRLILNLALVSLIGILIIFIIYEPGKEKKQQTVILDSYNPQKINSIILERDGIQVLKLEKEQLNWHIREPFDLPANNYQVNGLLHIGKNTSYSQINAKQHNIEKFGLKTPAIRLHLDEHIISFGGTEPLNFRRYAQAGDTIHLTNDGSYLYLSQDINKFISFKLLPVDKKIMAITLPGFQLSKNTANGRWQVTPENNTLSPDQLNKFIDEWQNTQATEVVSWPNKLKTSSMQLINIHFTDKSKLSLTIINDKTDLILGRVDARIQYKIPKAIKNKLLHPERLISN